MNLKISLEIAGGASVIVSDFLLEKMFTFILSKDKFYRTFLFLKQKLQWVGNITRMFQ